MITFLVANVRIPSSPNSATTREESGNCQATIPRVNAGKLELLLPSETSLIVIMISLALNFSIELKDNLNISAKTNQIGGIFEEY